MNREITTGLPEQFFDWPEIMTSQDVADAIGRSVQTAIKMMKTPGFPLLNPEHKRNMRVNRYRFLMWLRTGGEA